MTQNHRAEKVSRSTNMTVKKVYQLPLFFYAEQLLTFEFGNKSAVNI